MPTEERRRGGLFQTAKTKTQEESSERGWSKLKSLDGKNRVYTISVLTTLALGIATVYFDADLLNRPEDEDEDVLAEMSTPVHTFNAAGERIFRAIVLLILCIFIAATAFFPIGLNVYPFTPKQVTRRRVWLVLASVCLIIFNAGIVLAMISSQERYGYLRDDADSYQSGFSHYFLLVSLIASTLIMDVLSLDVFSQTTKELEETEHKGWNRLRDRLTSIRRLGQPPTAEPEQQPSFGQTVMEAAMKGFNWVLDKILDFLSVIVEGARSLLGRKEVENQEITRRRAFKYFTQDLSNVFLDVTKWIAESCLLKSIHSILHFFTWGMWAPFRAGLGGLREREEDEQWSNRVSNRMVRILDNVIEYWQTFGENFRGGVDDWYDDIREDEQFKHSAWVLAAMCTSSVLLIYFGVGLSTQISGYIDEMYIPRRNCAVRSLENNGELGNLIFRLAGFTEANSDTGDAASRVGDIALTEAACSADFSADQLLAGETIPFDPNAVAQEAQENVTAAVESTQLTETLDDPSQRDVRFYRCSTDDFSEEPCLALMVINQLEQETSRELGETESPMHVFREHSLGEAIYVIDRMIRHLRWSIWVGLLVGIGVGAFSLLSVLAQYKRFSLAIRSGFFEDIDISEHLAITDKEERARNNKRMEAVVTETKWANIIELYPMGASVFFFGILVSTAVIQLVVFGGAMAMLLSLIASIFDERVFAILRPYLALLIAFLITWFINGPMAQLVISEGILVHKYRVFHELSFLLFLLVYTAVHLVLGVFFALIRLIWVLLTTVACLNRLDRNLFQILKGNDLGHKSFMSMVLMQHAFVSNADAGEKIPFLSLMTMLRERQMDQPPPGPSTSVSMPPTPEVPDVPKDDTPKDDAPKESTKDETPKASTKLASAESTPVYLREDFDDIPPSGGPQQPPSNLPIV